MKLLQRSHSLDFIKILALSQKKTPSYVQKVTYVIRNRRVLKESRTDMESATFETLETAVAITVAVVLTLENARNMTLLQQCW